MDGLRVGVGCKKKTSIFSSSTAFLLLLLFSSTIALLPNQTGGGCRTPEVETMATMMARNAVLYVHVYCIKNTLLRKGLVDLKKSSSSSRVALGAVKNRSREQQKSKKTQTITKNVCVSEGKKIQP